MIPTPDPLTGVRTAMRKHWGFDTFRPLQADAVGAAMEGRDSVVVIPTGGGKSLCYQAPAATRDDGLTLVVSPLIALMKDQVDALVARAIPTALYNSSLAADQRRDVVDGLRARRYRLLYVAPERLPDGAFVALLRSVGVRSVAVDEAHCISHWGHDFRPDYRKLSQLKSWFPGAAVHAFTATATPRVREDIADQLQLENPRFIVGDFDRPNLTYRVQWRSRLKDAIRDIIDADHARSGIIYCIRRMDVDELAAYLQRAGYRALPYHAGLSPETRKANQNAFSEKRADIIVATVAFGMGIDRPDIRFVIHTGMPKSIEAYQQETGRAGRDGLPALCALFYTGADFMTWKAIIEKNESEHLDVHVAQLGRMLDFCKSTQCRHRLLVEHFGQTRDGTPCGACDNCLGEQEIVPDSTTVAMKILSAVVRTGERYGAKYVADVLIGADTQQIHDRGHQSLSVYGLMKEHTPREIRDWIEQLAADHYLHIGTEYRTFSLTEKGYALMHGEHEVALVARPEHRPRARTRRQPRASMPPSPRNPTHNTGHATPVHRIESAAGRPQDHRAYGGTVSYGPETDPSPTDGDGADYELYEALRSLRNTLADEKHLPGYCVLSNKTLECIARSKPTNESQLLAVPGIGPKKQRQYGAAFLACVRRHIGA